MPIIDNLIGTNQQNTNTNESNEAANFSTLDLKYALRQLNLEPETSRHCNFNVISDQYAGTYRFNNGFNGLTDMPAAFQRVMDYTVVGLIKLDEDHLRVSLPKCHLAKTEIE